MNRYKITYQLTSEIDLYVAGDNLADAERKAATQLEAVGAIQMTLMDKQIVKVEKENN